MVQKPGPFLWKRGNGYAFRIAVPLSLRDHFQRTHITEGLGTDSLKEAQAKRDGKLAEWRLTFQRAKEGAALLPAEIETEAHLYYRRELDVLDDAAKAGAYRGDPFEGPNGELITPEEVALDAAHEQCVEAIDEPDFSVDTGGPWDVGDPDPGRYCLIAATIRDIERHRGIMIDPTTGTYAALAKALLSARIAALEGRMRYLKGQSSIEPESFSGAKGIDPKTLKPVVPLRTRPIIRSDGGLRFSEAAALYLAEQQRDKGAALRAQTVEERKRIFKLFEDHIGDATLKNITRSDAADFLTTMAAERKITNKTLNYYSVGLSRVFKWARKSGKLDEANPFAEQYLPEAKGTGYVPYTDDELAKLIGSFDQPFTGPLAWATVISLYSGLRINEIAQLDAEDIGQEYGIAFFDLKEGNGKLLKTDAAARRVPVHSKLIGYGLIEYAQGVAKGPLWSGQARGNPDAKPGKGLSQKFGEHRKKLGLTRDRLSFHSLRKCFTTALDRAGVPLADAQALLGHSRGFSWDVYSGGPGLKRLQEIVGKVEYPGLKI